MMVLLTFGVAAGAMKALDALAGAVRRRWDDLDRPLGTKPSTAPARGKATVRRAAMASPSQAGTAAKRRGRPASGGVPAQGAGVTNVRARQTTIFWKPTISGVGPGIVGTDPADGRGIDPETPVGTGLDDPEDRSRGPIPRTNPDRRSQRSPGPVPRTDPDDPEDPGDRSLGPTLGPIPRTDPGNHPPATPETTSPDHPQLKPEGTATMDVSPPPPTGENLPAFITGCDWLAQYLAELSETFAQHVTGAVARHHGVGESIPVSAQVLGDYADLHGMLLQQQQLLSAAADKAATAAKAAHTVLDPIIEALAAGGVADEASARSMRN
jgi:hypothetical protein